jgi:hypothetical protein
VDAAELDGWRLVVGVGVDTKPRLVLAQQSSPKICLAAPPTAC